MKKKSLKKINSDNEEPRNQKTDLPVPSTSRDPDVASCNSATEISSIGEECLEHDSQDVSNTIFP